MRKFEALTDAICFTHISKACGHPYHRSNNNHHHQFVNIIINWSSSFSICQLHHQKTRNRPTDGPTDRPTDGRTDKSSCSVAIRNYKHYFFKILVNGWFGLGSIYRSPRQFYLAFWFWMKRGVKRPVTMWTRLIINWQVGFDKLGKHSYFLTPEKFTQ